MTRCLRSGIGSTLMILAVCLFLTGCGGGGGNAKVTEENAKKINTGMSEKEVKDILGEPSDTNQPPNHPEMKALTWKNGNNAITVTFKDGKVEMKQSQFVK